MPQAMYKREKKVHLTTSAVKIGYKHLWNSKFNFWMLKQPHPFLRLCTLHSSSVSENTEKKRTKKKAMGPKAPYLYHHSKRQLKRPIHQLNSPLFTYEAIGLASFFCLQKACSRRQVLSFSTKSHFAVLCFHSTSGLSKFFSSSKNKCLFKRESRRTRQYLTYQPYQARQKPILELQDDTLEATSPNDK